jgi:uncharacterized DUF497 family protein
MPEPTDPIGFDWDNGNAEKNWNVHRVSAGEIEEIFFNEPFVVEEDAGHSDSELRHRALGRTDSGRLIFAAYTIRGEKVRVISARDMTGPERREYERAREKAFEANSKV